MADENLWGEMLDVLKDISNYLEKEVVIQEKAKIDKPPKISEYQEEMTGGPAPSGKPAEGVAQKGYIAIPDVQDEDTTSIEESGASALKKAEKEDDSDKEDSDSKEESDEESDDVEELKSLLKDIKNALLTKSVDSKDISKLISTEVRREIPSAVDKMLRKMGYAISKPDVTKLDAGAFGVEEDVKKSGDEKKVEDLDKQVEEANKTVNDLTKKSWSELGRLRDQLGDFKVFPR